MNVRQQVPDGGWGWMVVLGSAVTNMVNQSLFSQFGLIYRDKLNEMNEGIAGASLAVNISSMITSFTGLITGPIMKKLSVRQSTILGVLLTAVGMALSSLATNLTVIILTFSLCTGIGLGLIMPASFMAVDQYFNKRKSLAVGISMAGTGLGQMLMPQLIRYLLDKFDYEGTTLILGAICLHGIPAALLFQPVKYHMRIPDEERQLLLENVIENNHNNDTTTAEIPRIKERQPTLCEKIVKWFHLELLRDFTFVHIIVGLAVAYTCNTSFNTIIPFFLQDYLLISRADTATVMSLISGADLISRFTIPLITKPLQISCRTTYLLAAASLAILRTVLSAQVNVRIIFVLAVFCGYARAGIVISQNLAVSEYCTQKEKLAGALGLNMVAKGFGVLIVGQFFGWIRDATDSFVVCINIQSVVLFIVAVSGATEILIRRRCFRSSQVSSS